MSVIVYPEIVMPNAVIEAGIRGRVIRRNERVPVASGYEAINIIWDRSLREYELGTVPLRRAAWQQLEGLFEVTDGGAYGFLMLDPHDSSVGAAEGFMAGPLTGYPNTFQLFKRYWEPVSGRWKDRKITRPIAASLAVTYNGAPATINGVDVTNGRIEIAGATNSALLAWTGRFYVPVHFANDQIDWEMLIAGPNPDARFMAGPSVLLREILEGLPVE